MEQKNEKKSTEELTWHPLKNAKKSSKSFLKESLSNDHFPGLATRSNPLKAKFDIVESEKENKTNKQKRSRASSGESSKRTSLILDLGVKVKNLSKAAKMAEDELRYEALQFAHSTTAHGIPMVIFE